MYRKELTIMRGICVFLVGALLCGVLYAQSDEAEQTLSIEVISDEDPGSEPVADGTAADELAAEEASEAADELAVEETAEAVDELAVEEAVETADELAVEEAADELAVEETVDESAGEISELAAEYRVSEAFTRLTWAKRADAPKWYPEKFAQADKNYNAAVAARDAGDWNTAYETASQAISALSQVVAPPDSEMPQNPAQYVIRPWDEFGNCFWNIAEFFYGNPRQWPVIYRANRDKLPDSNNPNLVEVGTLLDIPSIGGEIRSGVWDSGRPFSE
jgi:nucleoid-associated protein YgaU